MKRYQELNFLGKIYRKRYYFFVPFIAIMYKSKGLVIKSHHEKNVNNKFKKASFRECWRVAKNFIQKEKMNWYYSFYELQKEALKRIQKNEIN